MTAPEENRVTANSGSVKLRHDMRALSSMIGDGKRILDIGCGEGVLLEHLVRDKAAVARGLELSQQLVNKAVARGLSVIQGNADTDLVYYPDQSFDYAILSQTLQATNNPRAVVAELLRIGRRAVVSFPHFGHWRVRLSLGLSGRMPVTKSLSYQWYETPNIHFCTIKDFFVLCRDMDVVIEQFAILDAQGKPRNPALANLLGHQAIFVLRNPRNS